MPNKTLRVAQERSRRHQTVGEKEAREVELMQEMEEGYNDPAFMPSAEHLALAEHSVTAAQMTVAYSSGFSDFESGNDLPAMPPPGPERERLLDPDLPLDEMTEEMRTVCVQLDELKEKMRLGKNVYLRGEDFMAVIVCVRSVSSRKRSTTRTPGPCNEIFAPELQVHRKAARACTHIFGITACRPCDKLVRKRSTKKLPEGQVHAKY
jgi:hypothetical protein